MSYAKLSPVTIGRRASCIQEAIQSGRCHARAKGTSTASERSDESVGMPPEIFKPVQYTGMTYEETLNTRKTKLFPNLFTYYKKPLFIHQGYKQWLYDIKGRRYLDMFAGIVTVSVGHCHPRLNETAKKQMDRLWHTTNIYLHPTIHEYAEKLTSRLPDPLKVCFFANTGSEANDLAMLMMRAHTKNFDVVCLRNSYHGAGPYTVGLLSHSTWKPPIPTGFGNHAVINPDVYRGVWGGGKCRDSPVQADRTCDCQPGECKACDKYIDQLQELLDYNVPKKIAGFFAEPIQGVGGTVQYPKNYLKRAYKLIRDHGGLCLADEVQTGFGRLGEHFWGFESHDVVPDIVTMAKGIGNGFPMAAVVTTREIAESLNRNIYFNTYGGNPVGCAIAGEVLNILEDENLQANCDRVGTHMLLELAKLRDEFPIVGDVRGKGLMIGVELVEDKKTKKPLDPQRMLDVWDRTKNHGVLFGKGGYFGNVLRIKPPMCVTVEDANFAVSVLRQSIREHLDEVL